MNDTLIRYQFDPALTDTAGFFRNCIPLTDESHPPAVDSLKEYCYFGIFHYITPRPEPKKLLRTESVFAPHHLKASNRGPKPRIEQSTDWITFILIACLLVFAWIRTTYPKRLIQIFRAAAQPHFVNQLEREGNLFRERISLGLGLVYFTSMALFIFLLFREFSGIPSGLRNIEFMAVILGGLMTYHLLKAIAISGTGFIFRTGESSRQYQLNTLIFNLIIGIILFPVTILAFYWDATPFLILGLVVSGILMVYRLIRGVMSGLEQRNFNLFYLFLYLCTLEILPLLLLYKAAQQF
jgi:hypothetical protein